MTEKLNNTDLLIVAVYKVYHNVKWPVLHCWYINLQWTINFISNSDIDGTQVPEFHVFLRITVFVGFWCFFLEGLQIFTSSVYSCYISNVKTSMFLRKFWIFSYKFMRKPKISNSFWRNKDKHISSFQSNSVFNFYLTVCSMETVVYLEHGILRQYL